MVCLGVKPGAAGRMLQTNPLSYGSFLAIFPNFNLEIF